MSNDDIVLNLPEDHYRNKKLGTRNKDLQPLGCQLTIISKNTSTSIMVRWLIIHIYSSLSLLFFTI